jgi:TolA-binding protein
VNWQQYHYLTPSELERLADSRPGDAELQHAYAESLRESLQDVDADLRDQVKELEQQLDDANVRINELEYELEHDGSDLV